MYEPERRGDCCRKRCKIAMKLVSYNRESFVSFLRDRSKKFWRQHEDGKKSWIGIKIQGGFLKT